MNKFIDNIIKEGVKKIGDNFEFDFNNNNQDDIMSLKFNFRKNPTKKVDETSYCNYYAYSLEKSNDSGDLMKAIKMLDSSIDNNSLNILLNKAIIGFMHNFNMSFDTIVTPESSSIILSELSKKLQNKIGSTNIFPSAFVKNATMEIRFDEEKVNELPEKNKNEFIAIYNKVINSGKSFKMKEINPARYRKFFKNFIIFNNDNDRKLYNAVEGKNVILIDDYKTSGTTLKAMLDNLIETGAKNVVIFVLIRVK